MYDSCATIECFVDPSTALWFWAVDRHWDQGGEQEVSGDVQEVGNGAAGEVGEGMQREEAAEKERKEELERRHAAEWREDREKKFERVRRAKAALEDLVARSSMHDLLVLWFNHVSCSENLLVVCFIYEHYYRVIM